MAQRATVQEIGLIGYVMSHSETLGDAYRQLARYSTVLSENMKFFIADGPTTFEIRSVPSPRFDSLCHPVDARLATIVGFGRELTGRDIVPLEVRFPYSRPESTTEHERFFRCPLTFDSDAAAIVFRHQDTLDATLKPDRTLVGYLAHLADHTLEALDVPETFLDRARQAIWEDMTRGQPSLQRVAVLLRVSTRTLQRRLREEGTSFGALLEDIRKGLAVQLLRDRNLAVYEVAFLLGYTEPSTFHRAFRRWKDLSPQEYRQKVLARSA